MEVNGGREVGAAAHRERENWVARTRVWNLEGIAVEWLGGGGGSGWRDLGKENWAWG